MICVVGIIKHIHRQFDSILILSNIKFELHGEKIEILSTSFPKTSRFFLILFLFVVPLTLLKYYRHVQHFYGVEIVDN